MASIEYTLTVDTDENGTRLALPQQAYGAGSNMPRIDIACDAGKICK